MITTVKKAHEHKLCQDKTKIVSWNLFHQTEGMDVIDGIYNHVDDSDLKKDEYYLSRDHAGDSVKADEEVQVFVNPDELLAAIEKTIRYNQSFGEIVQALLELRTVYEKYMKYVKEE